LADVEENVNRFGVQLRFCIEQQLSFPCLNPETGEPIPLDWTYGAEIPASKQHAILWCYCGAPPFADLNKQLFFSEQAKIEIKTDEPTKVKEYFKNRLRQFLTSRFRFAKTNPSVSSGLSFKVVTSSVGLRVHYSPAYYFNPSLFFGSPTTHVSGTLQPGRYMFGVAGVGFASPKFSDAEFDVPPNTQADLLEL
ncbi:MAG TPA: hypothetical protein VF435_11315, partial [Pyrinomonadaceae bacterium]